jgi:hypothetical protein
MSNKTLEFIVSPALTAILGLIAGLLLAQFNANESTNKYFLEKQAKTADDIAVEFSIYVENWGRLMRIRKEFDLKKDEPSQEERENFKKIVFARSDARDKLFSALDSVLLYYDQPTSELVLQFKSWDDKQAYLTIDKLPSVDKWRDWQINILRQLHQEIQK